MLRAAASDVALYQPTTAEVQARLEGLRAVFADRPAWVAFLDRHGLDELTLQEELHRRMIVERFLLRNVSTAPSERGPWLQAVEALIQALQPRFRIRSIPLEGSRPEGPP